MATDSAGSSAHANVANSSTKHQGENRPKTGKNGNRKRGPRSNDPANPNYQWCMQCAQGGLTADCDYRVIAGPGRYDTGPICKNCAVSGRTCQPAGYNTREHINDGKGHRNRVLVMQQDRHAQQQTMQGASCIAHPLQATTESATMPQPAFDAETTQQTRSFGQPMQSKTLAADAPTFVPRQDRSALRSIHGTANATSESQYRPATGPLGLQQFLPQTPWLRYDPRFQEIARSEQASSSQQTPYLGPAFSQQPQYMQQSSYAQEQPYGRNPPERQQAPYWQQVPYVHQIPYTQQVPYPQQMPFMQTPYTLYVEQQPLGIPQMQGFSASAEEEQASQGMRMEIDRPWDLAEARRRGWRRQE